jgi:hypothetical protein
MKIYITLFTTLIATGRLTGISAAADASASVDRSHPHLRALRPVDDYDRQKQNEDACECKYQVRACTEGRVCSVNNGSCGYCLIPKEEEEVDAVQDNEDEDVMKASSLRASAILVKEE